MRMRLQLLALGTLIIGKKHEAAIIQPLEQQGTQVRLAAGIHGGEHHGVGFGGFDFHGLLEPGGEQAQGFYRGLAFQQAITGVVAAQIG